MSKLILVYAHGGTPESDPGAVNTALKVNERDWIKEFYDKFVIPELTSRKLEYKTVQQTSWYKIDSQVNAVYEKGDLAIACHLNAGPVTATGTEVLHSGSVNGEKLAKLVNTAIVKTLGLRDRGLKVITIKDRGGRLVVGTKPPCILPELFFLSNNNDYKIGTAKRKELAKAIVDAYEAFRAGKFI